jgi:spore coat polysaccharide biosynthesis predicted glycosyltransferase SpsG
VLRFRQAAATLAADGIATVFVGAAPQEAGGPAAHARLQLLPALPQADLAALMRGARLVLANGGSTLLQAIACGRACVAAPIAGDQRQRIGRCAAAGVAIAAPLQAEALAEAARALWRDPARLQGLAARAAALGLADGVEMAVQALADLVPATSRPAAASPAT